MSKHTFFTCLTLVFALFLLASCASTNNDAQNNTSTLLNSNSSFEETFVPPPDVCVNFSKRTICGNDNITYANECYLTKAGAEIGYFGSCSRDTEYFENTGCLNNYAPVCTRIKFTFQNECIATYYNMTNITPGICPQRDVACGLTEPVCGTDGKTYGNICTARARKVVVAYQGAC